MVGPEDAGTCSGRNPKLFPVPAPEPAGLDGKMIRATGVFGGGAGAVETPEEEEEEEEEEETPPPQQLLRRYLAATGGQLEPGLCYCPLPAGQPRVLPRSAAPHSDACPPGADSKHRGAEAADARAARHGGMTNGDSGFLPGPDYRDLARAGGREPRHRRLRPEGPGDEGADGAGSPSDWAAPLEDPLRSCCLAAADAERPEDAGSGSGDSPASSGSGSEDLEQPGAGPGGPEEDASPVTSAERTSGGAGAESRLVFSDVHLNSRNTFEVSRHQSARDHLPPSGPPVPSPAAEHGPAGTSARARRSGGFADFFARNLFPKRTKELKSVVHSAPGWKLFGKVPPRENLQKTSRIIQQEYEARTGRTCKPPPQSSRRKNFEFEPLSTTALILEDRPSNLPAKSVEEALRHRQEYDEMVAEAKKREIKEAHKRKKIMKERFKQEENIASAMVIWINEILPNWEVMRSTRRVRELWWQGLPPSVRGKVWSLAVGNELNITPELYEIFLSRAKERWKSFSETNSENDVEGVSVADREASLELIKLDISRTFPSLYIFQKGGPYHDVLHSILGAYTCYRPDVGYVQGMSFIAAVLILNLEEADAFIAFANLLNKPCQLAFFRVDHSMMLRYFATFEVFFEENLSKLFLHFKSYSLTPDIYLIDWIFTLYSKSLPLDLACRVWDVFCRDGEEFLFRTGLGILRLYEDILLQMDFIHIAQFLTKLPEDITSEKLFTCIAAIQMQNSTKKWTQVFASVMKDIKEGDKNNSPALKS
ncbi:TBC1 domain family member 12 isoform X1 [Physeter macrocephalus]|uniref:TBC1 domain family member 12 isoform X1 n=1 Tax=Physeter macrocephalus TaxID=9755 RepID=A0A2Y9SNK0_PHYMC|nr:TBC1 domain family member 12 isoform X1 [Physeter catodon]|eukprot:XP_023977319.1 TBC1 domain family member 12 isoform X1 [Physeter catodon]